MGQLVQDEGEHERTVDAFRSEDLQQLTHVRRLFVFITDVVAVQPKRYDSVLVPLDDLSATRALVGRTFVGARTELGDRHRFALRDKRTDASGVPVGDLNRPVGLYAMAESAAPYGLTSTGEFGFLPFIVSSAALNQTEVGNTLTSFGASLGLLTSDINGNASHNIFTSTGGMNVVDYDAAGDILSLAVRAQVTPVGVVPEPESALLLLSGLAALAFGRRQPRRPPN